MWIWTRFSFIVSNVIFHLLTRVFLFAFLFILVTSMLSNSESSGLCNVDCLNIRWLNYLLFVGNRSCTDLTRKAVNGRRGEWGLWSCWNTWRQEKLGLSWGRTRPLRSAPIILVSTRNFCECIIQFFVCKDCMHLISYSDVLIDLILWMVCVFFFGRICCIRWWMLHICLTMTFFVCKYSPTHNFCARASWEWEVMRMACCWFRRWRA